VVGIAGGVFGRGPALGDVVVPDYLHYGEFRKLSGRGDHRRYYAYDQPSVSLREDHVDPVRYSGAWRARIGQQPPQACASNVVIGGLVAGEKVLGDPTHEEQRKVLRDFGSAVAIDMESVGAARAVHEERRWADYNPRLLVVRGISDFVRGADEDPAMSIGVPRLPRNLREAVDGLVRAPQRARALLRDAERIVRPGQTDSLAAQRTAENSAERGVWKDYAAAVAAAFAAELVHRLTGWPP
jgi:hypothetical protein